MVQSLPPNAPAPRLCTLSKTAPTQEYGYNLHAEKGRGQFVGMVDKGSVADIGGLKTGDRIFAINGHSIVGESHKKVVDRIKEQPTKCEMLVATEEEAKWYTENNIQITLQLPNIVRLPGEAVSHRGSNANSSPPPATWYAPSSKPADPVFIAPPPPHDDMDHPLPVICVLEKTTPSDEFGFNLHAEKGRGHFIGTVDHGGIGDRAGLKISQRIVGVNGTLVYPTTPHKEVVALIKKSPLSTTLLLASEDVDQWYKDHKKEFSFDEARRALEPEQPLSPHSIQISDEEILEEHPSPAPRHAEEAPVVQYEAPPMAQYDLVPADDGDETDIMAAVFGKVPLPVIGAGVELAAAEPVPEPREQQHLVEHAGHHEPALVAEHLPEEEHHHIEEHVPAYNAYASPPLSEVHHHHHHHQQQQQHHDDHYHADYNHNGHSHDHYHNGKSNGYSSPNSVASSDQDIFHLSAKEARERLRQQKRRAQDMSLEEKYRLVSNM